MIHSADQWVSHVKEYALKLIYCLFKLGQTRESLLIGTVIEKTDALRKQTSVRGVFF